jgi:hypothetical protein
MYKCIMYICRNKPTIPRTVRACVCVWNARQDEGGGPGGLETDGGLS